MAKIEEDRYNFTAAAHHYSAFLALPASASRLNASDRDAIRKRILVFAWVAGNRDTLERSLANRAICTRALRSECAKFEALKYLIGRDVSESQSQSAIKKARSAPLPLRALWAGIALENPTALSQSGRRQMVEKLAKHWSDLDPMVRFALLPKITRSVPKVFEIERIAISKSPVRADERSLAKRIRLIADLEKAATRAAALPWSRIRARVLDEIGMA